MTLGRDVRVTPGLAQRQRTEDKHEEEEAQRRVDSVENLQDPPRGGEEEKTMKTPAKVSRPFYQSKEWWTGLGALIAGIVALASGQVELTIQNLQELIPTALLVVGGVAAMFSAAGRTRLERQLEDATRLLAVLAQTDSRPALDQAVRINFQTLGTQETVRALTSIRDLANEAAEAAERAGLASQKLQEPTEEGRPT